MCYSLSGSLGKMDMCINVLADGTPEEMFSILWGDIAGGTYVPNSRKALPQCDQVNVQSTSSSVYASLAAVESTAMSSATDVAASTTDDTKAASSASHAARTSGSDYMTVHVQSGLNQDGKIAIGVGLGMVCPSFSSLSSSCWADLCIFLGIACHYPCGHWNMFSS